MTEKSPGRGDPAVRHIDWDALHRRSADTGAATVDAAPSPEDEKRILHARARLLAREPHTGEAAGERIEIVEFQLAFERYGIESSYVSGVCPLKDLAPLPCTPPFVLGITHVRGRIVSVIDVKRFFDLPERGLTDLNKVILLRSHTMEFAVLADAVVGVRAILRRELETSLPTLTGIRAEYLLGVTPDPLVILDAAKLLADRKIVVHDEAAL